MAGLSRRLVVSGIPMLAACSRMSARGPAVDPPVMGHSGIGPREREIAPAKIARLIAGYPDHLAGSEGDTLVWTDGTCMPLGAGQPNALSTRC